MDERERIKEISGLINGILDAVNHEYDKAGYLNKDDKDAYKIHKKISKSLAARLHRIAQMIEDDEI